MVRLASSNLNLASLVQPGEILTSRQLQSRLVLAGKTPANARKIISRAPKWPTLAIREDPHA